MQLHFYFKQDNIHSSAMLEISLQHLTPPKDTCTMTLTWHLTKEVILMIEWLFVCLHMFNKSPDNRQILLMTDRSLNCPFDPKIMLPHWCQILRLVNTEHSPHIPFGLLRFADMYSNIYHSAVLVCLANCIACLECDLLELCLTCMGIYMCTLLLFM